MKPSLEQIRRHATAIAVFIVVASVSWWALWSIAAGQYRNVIDGWIASGRAAGYQISYDDRRLFGFPRHIVLRFTNLHWKNTDGIDFHVGQIDIGAIPWQWQKFYAKFKGYAEIDAPLVSNYALIIGGEKGSATVELDKDGYWQFSRLILTDARTGRSPDYVFLADRLEATAKKPAEEPKSHKDTGLTLSGEATNVALPNAMPSPFGRKMEHMLVNLRVMDAVPDFRLKKSVDAWNKDSGVVEFDQLQMNWGTLNMSAKGTMGFDDDLQPEGAFAGAVGHQQEVLQALKEGGFIPPRQEAMLSSALALFGKPSKLSDEAGMELPITVQLGGLFLGPVKIFVFPEIVWPEEVPGVSPAAATSAPLAPAPAAPPPVNILPDASPAPVSTANPSPASPPAAAPP